MVLNAMKKLLQQGLQIATFKVPHYVGSLTIALFILLNCMPFILPLGSSASRRKSPSWWSDSLSVLKSISSAKCDNPLLVDLFNLYFKREETILYRLHIGHTFLTHFYLLKGEEPPVCIPCDQLCSIEHLLTGCVDLIEWRRHSFKTESLSVLFRECSADNIIQFLKYTNLFNKL